MGRTNGVADRKRGKKKESKRLGDGEMEKLEIKNESGR